MLVGKHWSGSRCCASWVLVQSELLTRTVLRHRLVCWWSRRSDLCLQGGHGRLQLLDLFPQRGHADTLRCSHAVCKANAREGGSAATVVTKLFEAKRK